MHDRFLKALADLPLPRRYALAAMMTALGGFALASVAPLPVDLSAFFLSNQDRWLLLVQGLLLIAIGQKLGTGHRPLSLPGYALPVAAVLIVALCYLGHLWALRGYDMSRDEQMAVFDARIFSAGLRVQPLPLFWQRHASALNTLFMLPVEHPRAWVSAYLPMNALLRSVVGLIADPALTGPLLTGIGAVPLFKCARLLWPDDREAAVVALILYLTSGQILLTGMTAFAMPAHLTLDLIWLWHFLKGRRSADLVALAVGFVATGLHQPLFHPLFVLPFLALLLRERAWSRVGLYGVGYALICLFWLAWPGWTHTLVAGPDSVTAMVGTDYWSRLKLMLATNSDPRWFDMGANLLRMIAWQNILLLPLIGASASLASRNQMVAALLASLVLPVVIMTVIIPFQGYGFGYRYLHGVLGSAIFLAVYGWRRLVPEHGHLRPLLVRGAILTAIVLIPIQLWMTHSLYAAFASVDQRIAGSRTDYFVVGGGDTSFAGDLILNRPDLSNRPIRFFAEALQGPLTDEICAAGPRIGLPTTRLFEQIDAYFVAPPDPAADERIRRLTPKLQAAGCRVVILDGSPSPGPLWSRLSGRVH